jgi:hypothetical protein
MRRLLAVLAIALVWTAGRAATPLCNSCCDEDKMLYWQHTKSQHPSLAHEKASNTLQVCVPSTAPQT